MPALSLHPRCTRRDQKPLTWVVLGRASRHGCPPRGRTEEGSGWPWGPTAYMFLHRPGVSRWAPIATALPRVVPPKRCPCWGALPAGLTPRGGGREEGDWPTEPSAGRAPRPLQRVRRWALPHSSRGPNSAAPTGGQSRLPPPRGSRASEELNVVLGAREGSGFTACS